MLKSFNSDQDIYCCQAAKQKKLLALDVAKKLEAEKG